MEVHSQLGCGVLEAVYHEALALEFAERRIPCQREQPLQILYKGRQLSAGYRTDFICFETAIAEVKALDRLSGIEEAQLLNDLKATGK